MVAIGNVEGVPVVKASREIINDGRVRSVALTFDFLSWSG